MCWQLVDTVDFEHRNYGFFLINDPLVALR